MVNYLNRPPRPGSVDEAAQRFLRMLEREEREAAELKRLKESGWQPPHQLAPPHSSDAVFGDGRDAIVNQVQAAIDYRNALRTEAQRRAAPRAPMRATRAARHDAIRGDYLARMLIDPGLAQLLGLGTKGTNPYGDVETASASPYTQTAGLSEYCREVERRCREECDYTLGVGPRWNQGMPFFNCVNRCAARHGC